MGNKERRGFDQEEANRLEKKVRKEVDRDNPTRHTDGSPTLLRAG
jgi:hypothetical protein